MAGSLGVVCFFQGMELIPTSITTVILNMKGIVILLLSMVFLQDKITFKSVLCIGLCFVGAVLIVKPSLLLPAGWTDRSAEPSSGVAGAADPLYLLGCYLIIFMCFFKSAITIWIRRFGNSGVGLTAASRIHPLHNLILFCTASLIVNSLACVLNGKTLLDFSVIGFRDVLAGIACGVSALILQSKPDQPAS